MPSRVLLDPNSSKKWVYGFFFIKQFHTKVQKSNNPYQNHSFHTSSIQNLTNSIPFFDFLLLLLFFLLPLLSLRFSPFTFCSPKMGNQLSLIPFEFIFLLLQVGPPTLLYLQIKLCHLYNNLPSSYIMSFMSHFDKLQIYPYILYKFRVSKFSHLAK